MSKTLAVAARELRERWLFFPGGLACGFFPLVLPAFGIPVDGAIVVGALGALLLGMFAGLIAGASMLARDALDGRLGFLFSRPVPWPAIWGGKWLAATLLGMGSAVLTALPWMLVFLHEPGGGFSGVALLDPQRASLLFVLLLLTIGFANFNATVFRSRSAWTALDLGLLLLAAWLVWHWVAPLWTRSILGFPRTKWGFLVLLGVPTLALVAASIPQVVFGRTDLRRAHRAMSLAFWAVVFVSLAGAGLRLAWVRGARPSDLTVNAGSYDPSGRWLYVFGGSRRGGAASFLIDTEQGRHRPMGLARPWQGVFSGMAFSGDGRFGATLAKDSDGTALDLADLNGSEPRFTRVALEGSPPPASGTNLALSALGSAALLTHGHGASLFALPAGERVATATIPPQWRAVATRFLDESAARIWLLPVIGARPSFSEAAMRILELGAGREARTSEVSLAARLDLVRAWPRPVQPDAGGRRFLSPDGGVRLRDGATGALLATLVETAGPLKSPVVTSPATMTFLADGRTRLETAGTFESPVVGSPVAATFLADGRIVVGQAAGAQIKVRLFSAEGAPLREAMLDRVPAMLGVGPEVAPGLVAIHFSSSTRTGVAVITGYPAAVFFGDTAVFDVTEGRVVETLEDMRPVPDFWRLEPPARTAGAALPTVHFFARGGDLVRVDFATGERRVVAGPGAPATERLGP